MAGRTGPFDRVDLLRAGPRLPLSGLPACDYYAMLSRVEERPRVGVWLIGLRDPLPTIPVPLRPGRADVPVDLQAVFDRVYDGAGFARFLYATEPRPPLPPADAAWAADLAATARR